MNYSLAAAAEEAAREACRHEAKARYHHQRLSPTLSKAPEEKGGELASCQGAGDVDNEDHRSVAPCFSLPKAWLVQSFFTGYANTNSMGVTIHSRLLM